MMISKAKYENPEMDRLITDELAKLKQDELVYPFIANELKLSQKEAEVFLAALLDYQEDVHYCAACPGLENCNKPHPHFTLRLEREGAYLNRHYDPCAKMVSLASFKERFIRCSFPGNWRDYSIRDIEKSVSARKDVMRAMIEGYKGKERWLFLNGSSGSGKTFMLGCFANDITKKKGSGIFVDTETALTELKNMAIHKKEEFAQLMNEYANASVVVFDNFGNEFKTEFVYTSILYPILSSRDRAGKITCFASDFSFKEIASMYRAKIGPERTNQLLSLLERRCVKEFDVTGINPH